ncbi:MAG: DNA mismatch repair endonuclease MutL [Paenibacillaceae bacterium]|nr:DNA mismatch repair endonuclease MutL [Paenibacillaceae bacterium]
MGIIQVLDDHIANQIAAGEVVERPSSVVKELVENAIDAGAGRIDVTIEEGGLTYIRVADNGSGMAEDDCRTAFLRHATSKIASGKDLFRIRTLGFRGEALPSIAAVAKVECLTSSGADGSGWKLVIEGGEVCSFAEAAVSRGTDIQVRDLFFNTPARLKYMKTIQTELGNVSDYMNRLALAFPAIAFTLRHNGNVLLQTLGGGDLLQVIAAVYGSGAAKQLVKVEGENLDFGLTGYVSRPELTRSNRSAVTAIVNGRYIKNFALAGAVLNAYRTLLPLHRFPLAILQLTMEPSLLDVNVHPAKLEVRFSKEQELILFVEESIRQALRGQVLIPQGNKPASARPAVVQEQLALYRAETQADAPFGGSAAAAASLPARLTSPGPAAAAASSPARFAPPGPAAAPSPARSAPPGPGPASAASPTPQRPAAPLPADKLAALLEPAPDSPAELPQFPRLSPIGQLHGTYIVAQNETGLYLIDQHAAHERINYEYFYAKFGEPTDASQQLLVPITLDYTPGEAEQLAAKLPLFEQAGVYLEPFGGSTFIVRAHPYWMPEGDEKEIIEEMAEWILSERKPIDLSRLRDKSAALCSCKASIKANQSLSIAGMEALLDRLAACGNPYTCPHGRPIVVSFSSYELEKMFKRVM